MLKRILTALVFSVLAPGVGHAAIVVIPVFVPPPTVPGANQADYRQIHTVAVVSALGRNLTLRNYHFMGPKDHTQDISDWKLDGAVDAELKKYLSGRFTFKDIAYDANALAAIPNGKWDGLSPKFSNFMKSLPAEGIDAFIVVRPDLGLEAPGVQGIGLENGGAFGDMTPVLWENYEIDVIDARSGKEIASAYSRVRLRDKTDASFVGLFVTDRLRVGDDFRLDDTQTIILRKEAAYLLRISLIETLRSLDLGIALPLPGARDLVPFAQGKDPYRASRSAAIASAVGDRLDLEHMGVTIFSRDSYSVPEPGRELDTLLEDRAAQALHARFELKDAQADRAAFAGASLVGADGKFAPSFPGLSPRQDLDLYILFLKIKAPLPPPWAAEGTGVGLFNKSVIGGVTEAFANYALVVVDAHTMKAMLVLRAVPGPGRPDAVPVQTLDDSVWPSAPPALSESQKTQIHATLTDLLTDSENEVLLRSGLTGLTVSDEAPSQLQ